MTKTPHPNGKKAMQSFMGKINFVRKFISNFAKIVKPLQNIINKDVGFKWNQEEKDAFDRLKKANTKAPALYSLDFNKDFILYTFTSYSSLAIVLTQKDSQDNEWPIYFMSVSLHG